jgi:hypothetical protein
LVAAVDGDLQDLDDAEGGAEAAKRRVQLGVDLGHAAMMPAVYWFLGVGLTASLRQGCARLGAGDATAIWP